MATYDYKTISDENTVYCMVVESNGKTYKKLFTADVVYTVDLESKGADLDEYGDYLRDFDDIFEDLLDDNKDFRYNVYHLDICSKDVKVDIYKMKDSFNFEKIFSTNYEKILAAADYRLTEEDVEF